MIPLTVAQLAEMTGAALDQVPDPGAIVSGPVVIDSREARARRAVRGAARRAASTATTSPPRRWRPGRRPCWPARPVGVPALIVSDVQAALADLAAAVVRRLPGLTIVGDHRVRRARPRPRT